MWIIESIKNHKYLEQKVFRPETMKFDTGYSFFRFDDEEGLVPVDRQTAPPPSQIINSLK